MRAPSGREAELGAISAPEIRLDQLTGLRTILSPARADRPFDFGGMPAEPNEAARKKCPF